MSYLESNGLRDKVKMLLITHKHDDHSGGNQAFMDALGEQGLAIVGPSYESIPALTKPVSAGDSFALGGLSVSVLHTPCHTTGHIGYVLKSSTSSDSSAPLLFPGDTLFVGGCGRFFEGNAAQMLDNMRQFSQLPEETIVFPAHEYTTSNLKFLASVDGDAPALQQALAECTHRRSQDPPEPTVPTTLAAEAKYNLFFKCDELRTQQLVGASTAEEAMATLRARKNDFR
jgi:hydroxyacylglutathione hydrolase